MEHAQFGLLGRTLGHSFSPKIHRALGGYDYALFEREPEQLAPFLKEGKFRGLNVTIPYKKAVLPFCEELSAQARKIGSVNTILRQKDGSLLGHNTDYDGFLYQIEQLGLTIAGKKVVVLGTGGAASSVCAVLNDLQVGELISISRTGENNYDNLSRHADAQILVNTTPLGMYPETDATAVDLTIFSQLEGVFDLIYNPLRTKLLLQAEQLNLPCVNGLGMLVAQARAAVQLFLGEKISEDSLQRVLRQTENDNTNLLLVGMAGCGKTTVGGLLAQQLGREFVDTDALVEQMAGRTVPQIFATQGEETFRRLEHQALMRVCKRAGLVIATGGGAVTREENFAQMRQNSRVIFLKREVDALPTEGRPISQRSDLHQLYAQRLPLYNAVADMTVENCCIERTVAEIIRRCNL